MARGRTPGPSVEENTRKNAPLARRDVCAPLAATGGRAAGVAFRAGAVPHQREVAASRTGVTDIALESGHVRLYRAPVLPALRQLRHHRRAAGRAVSHRRTV